MNGSTLSALRGGWGVKFPGKKCYIMAVDLVAFTAAVGLATRA